MKESLSGSSAPPVVEHVNKWAYFAQNMGWMLSIPVALTLIYSNISGRIDTQEREIVALRSELANNEHSLEVITNKQAEQTAIMIEVRTLVEGSSLGGLRKSVGNGG